MKRTRILLADDHPQIRELLRIILEPEFKVVGTAEDGETLLLYAQSLQPDVIISDINMPKVDGLQAARILKDIAPPHTSHLSDRPCGAVLRSRRLCSGSSRLSHQGRDDGFSRLVAGHDRQRSRTESRTICPTGADEAIAGAGGRKTGPAGITGVPGATADLLRRRHDGYANDTLRILSTSHLREDRGRSSQRRAGDGIIESHSAPAGRRQDRRNLLS